MTYGGHPVAAAVALETLKIYEEMDLPNRVKTMGKVLASALEGLAQLPNVARVRSDGLIGAVDLVPDAAGEGIAGGRVAKAAQELRCCTALSETPSR